MNELLTGYCENPPLEKKGPRITKAGQENFLKNQGSFNLCYGQYGKNTENEVHNPKVHFEGKYNQEKSNGSLGDLLGNYGNNPISPKPMPRVKFEGNDNLDHNRGSQISKTLHMVPPTSRPSSTQFFNRKLY
jgi:hypothetical protein